MGLSALLDTSKRRYVVLVAKANIRFASLIFFCLPCSPSSYLPHPKPTLWGYGVLWEQCGRSGFQRVKNSSSLEYTWLTIFRSIEQIHLYDKPKRVWLALKMGAKVKYRSANCGRMALLSFSIVFCCAPLASVDWRKFGSLLLGGEQANGKSNWICVEFGYRRPHIPISRIGTPLQFFACIVNSYTHIYMTNVFHPSFYIYIYPVKHVKPARNHERALAYFLFILFIEKPHPYWRLHTIWTLFAPSFRVRYSPGDSSTPNVHRRRLLANNFQASMPTSSTQTRSRAYIYTVEDCYQVVRARSVNTCHHAASRLHCRPTLDLFWSN